MRLGAISGAASRRSGFDARQGEPSSPAPESRALVVVAPPASASMEPATTHRQASFLAHLIATKDQHPQTRQRRRAEPAEALTAYQAAAGLAALN